MGKLLNYLGESKILKRIADVLNVTDVKVNGASVVDNNGIADIDLSLYTRFEVVQTLPSVGESGVIYLVPKTTSETDNVYDEYIWTNNTWELIGSTEIDLSNYYTKTEVDNLIPTDFVPKSTGGIFDGNVEIVTANSGTGNVNSRFRLGNNKALGVLGNTRGVIQIFDQNGNYTNIFASNNANSGNVFLPKDKPTNSVLAIVGEAVDWETNGILGAKNLNAYPYSETSHTERGVDWTDNGDGSFTANRTATNTNNSNFQCHTRTKGEKENLVLKNGTYIFSGCPSGGSSTTYAMVISRSNPNGGGYQQLGMDTGNGITLTLDGDYYSNDEVVIGITCIIGGSYNAQNLTFKPMIRLAEDLDDTFQPYAMTNRQLTEVVKGVPTNSGTYTLQATRDSSGNITYSWV